MTLVLNCENIAVHRGPYSYVVTEKTSAGNTGGKPTYHANLPGAISEVSKRLFDRKLKGRAQANEYDFESLLDLVKAHNADMDKLFGIR